MLITMMLGAWHGANWTYILWGGLHGLYLVINHQWRDSVLRRWATADALPKADTSLDLEGLRHIIRIAKQKGIELTLFAYPKHEHWLKLDAVCGAYQSYWAGLAAIASLSNRKAAKRNSGRLPGITI